KIRLKKAENAGVEVSDGFYLIKDANNVLIKSRNSVHYFLIDKFIAVIEPGFEIANNALATSESALKEVQNRRLALAVISVIIFIAAISLYFKSKLIEKKL
ncbi:MAG: hypothetical protein SCK70_17030, partial [bacterium]|nr:hypothetical protein [bacterium]